MHGNVFQTMAQGERSQAESNCLAELRRQSSEYRETMTMRVYKAENQKEGSCTEI